MGWFPIIFTDQSLVEQGASAAEMTHYEANHLAAALLRKVGSDLSAEHIADAACAIWSEIHIALGPFFGSGGVAALYAWNLSLSRSTHPWLPAPPSEDQASMDLATLRSALARQPASALLEGAAAMLENFTSLLTSLIGSAMTERMLQVVGDPDAFEFRTLGAVARRARGSG
ncbi:MAG: hypothetical protein ACXWCV_03120 [Caldimonas sp.]